MGKGIQTSKGLKAVGIYYVDDESSVPCLDIFDDDGNTSTVTIEKLLKMFEGCDVEIKVSTVGGLDGR